MTAGLALLMLSATSCKVNLAEFGALKFRFILNPGFFGEAVAVEDPSLPLDYKKTYDVRVTGGQAKMPRGFLSASPPLNYAVVQIVDTSGKVLNDGDLEPPAGQMTFKFIARQRPEDTETKRVFIFYRAGTAVNALGRG
jgi:hypothetical protein